jgi:hypothetical protein
VVKISEKSQSDKYLKMEGVITYKKGNEMFHKKVNKIQT